MIAKWAKAEVAKSVGLLGNVAKVFPKLIKLGMRPDIVTD